jgi:hypothetical protein
VAHIYPYYLELPLARSAGALDFAHWMARYRDEWLRTSGDPFPWGIVALAALHQGDLNSAACWRAKARALRAGEHWDIAEEAVWQVLAARRLPAAQGC